MVEVALSCPAALGKMNNVGISGEEISGLRWMCLSKVYTGLDEGHPGMAEDMNHPSLLLLLLCFQADAISRAKHGLWPPAATMCPLHLCHPWLAVLHLGTSTEGSQAMVTYSLVGFGIWLSSHSTYPAKGFYEVKHTNT